MNRKGFINIVIIVVIASIIAAAGYFAVARKTSEAPATTQEVETTKNWKTYRNEEYGFEVKYPFNYEAGKLSGEGNLTTPPLTLGTTISNPEAQTPTLMPYVFIFEPATRDVSHNPNAKKLLDYKNNYFTNDVRKVVIKSQEDIDINGLSAIKQFYTAGDTKERLNKTSFTSEFWNSPATFDRNNLYRMSFGYEPNSVRYIFFDGKDVFIILRTESKYESFLDQIASSFKFHEDLTKNWKTYRNEEYKFEFKYPSEWSIERYEDFAGNFTLKLASIDTKIINLINPIFVPPVLIISNLSNLNKSANHSGDPVLKYNQKKDNFYYESFDTKETEELTLHELIEKTGIPSVKTLDGLPVFNLTVSALDCYSFSPHIFNKNSNLVINFHFFLCGKGFNTTKELLDYSMDLRTKFLQIIQTFRFL